MRKIVSKVYRSLKSMPSCPPTEANLSFGTFVAPAFSESWSLGEGNQATYVQLKYN